MEIMLKLNSDTAGYVFAEIREESGVKRQKKITVQDTIDILNSSAEIDHTCRIGKMPEGFLDAEFDFSSLSGKVAVYVPKHTQLTDFNGEKAMVPFPNLILMYKYSKGVHQGTAAFATVENNIRRINDNTILYNYPFGNVTPGTGKVCWGSNRHEPIERISEVNIFTDKFLNSSTNSDLYQVGVSNSSKKELSVFLHSLAKKHEKESEDGKEYIFEDKLLVPTINTFDSAFANL